MSNSSPTIALNRIVDLAAGNVAHEERLQLLAVLVKNPTLIGELDVWKYCVELTRSDNGEDAPTYVIHRALRLLTLSSAHQDVSPLRWIKAILCFDSAQNPLPMGIRTPQLNEQQLLFRAEGRDLDLRITSVGDLWSITGQVLGVDGNGYVELCNPPLTLQAQLNNLSEFTLPPISAGVYTLILYHNDVVIETPILEIGSLKQE